MQCPDCNHENPTGVTICENCGLNLYDGLLDQVETKQLQRLATRDLGLQTPPSSRPLLLYLSSSQAPLAIERRANLIIGRSDPKSEQIIDIDLAPFEGQTLGVSRQHARIDALEHPPLLVDLDSYNGTFVNGQRLNPNESRELESGDEIRFGRLITHLYYK